MNRTRSALLYAALVLALPATLRAQDTKTGTTAKPKPAVVKPKHETQAQLAKEAKISVEAATATAVAAVPGAKVKGHELEREKGKLIYSFELKVAGKSGIEEVNVDAMTGAVIEKVHETPADEKKEAAADKKKATTPPVKKP